MPDLARVDGSFPCFQCGFVVPRLHVQWGCVPESYQLGDAVRWLRRDGQILKSFVRVGPEKRWNAGAPGIAHLFVRDTFEFDPADEPECTRCNAKLGGAVLEVKDGKFVGGRLLRPGELPDFRYLKIATDGSVTRATEAEGDSVRWEDGAALGAAT